MTCKSVGWFIPVFLKMTQLIFHVKAHICINSNELNAEFAIIPEAILVT